MIGPYLQVTNWEETYLVVPDFEEKIFRVGAIIWQNCVRVNLFLA
jgi:hypothetical protein